MTSRSYFGKMNLILGSVVPLAMFLVYIECTKLREKMYEAVKEKNIFHLQDTSSVCEVLSNLAGQPLLRDRTHSKMIRIKFKGAGSVSR